MKSDEKDDTRSDQIDGYPTASILKRFLQFRAAMLGIFSPLLPLAKNLPTPDPFRNRGVETPVILRNKLIFYQLNPTERRVDPFPTISERAIPTSHFLRNREVETYPFLGYKYRRQKLLYIHPFQHQKIFNIVSDKLHSKFSEMASNLGRSLQNLTIGSEEAPLLLPTTIVNQAVNENQYTVIVQTLIPRRQNLRSVISVMPRTWGLSGVVQGRITSNRHFQFVFPSKELMMTTLNRGPWAFADRMVVLQRWFPMMNPTLMSRIPFWVQVRGIPFQYLNTTVIECIGRGLGHYMGTDYDEEATTRVDYVCIRLNINVHNPLHFQHNFQFTPGVNTLLTLKYERLRGVCEICGMLTHDTGGCLNQNGGDEFHPDDDDNQSADEEPMEGEAEIIPPTNGNANGNRGNGNGANSTGNLPDDAEGEGNVDAESEDEEDAPPEEEASEETHNDVYEGPVNRRYTDIVVDYGENNRKRKNSGFKDNEVTKKLFCELGEGSGTQNEVDDGYRGAVGPVPPPPP